MKKNKFIKLFLLAAILAVPFLKADEQSWWNKMMPKKNPPKLWVMFTEAYLSLTNSRKFIRF